MSELDKKAKGDKCRLILIEAIGKAIIKERSWKDISLDLSYLNS